MFELITRLRRCINSRSSVLTSCHTCSTYRTLICILRSHAYAICCLCNPCFLVLKIEPYTNWRACKTREVNRRFIIPTCYIVVTRHLGTIGICVVYVRITAARPIARPVFCICRVIKTEIQVCRRTCHVVIISIYICVIRHQILGTGCTKCSSSTDTQTTSYKCIVRRKGTIGCGGINCRIDDNWISSQVCRAIDNTTALCPRAEGVVINCWCCYATC